MIRIAAACDDQFVAALRVALVLAVALGCSAAALAMREIHRVGHIHLRDDLFTDRYSGWLIVAVVRFHQSGVLCAEGLNSVLHESKLYRFLQV
jgi:hypothetical protein